MTAVRGRPASEREAKTQRGFEMNSPTVEVEQAPSFQLAAVLDPAISSTVLWRQAYTFLREIEDHLRLLPENAQEGEAPSERIHLLFSVRDAIMRIVGVQMELIR